MKKILIKIFLAYIRFAARIQLKKIDPVIIGIGGASGKSSLAQLTYLILDRKFKVKESGGKNSETGIPLNILGIKIESYDFSSWIKIALKVPVKLLFDWEKYDVYIAEMGIDSPMSPKNMDYLLGLIKPNIAVLTNIQIEHSVYFDYLIKDENEEKRKEELVEKIKEQEILLINRVKSSGRVVINIDDENIKKSSNLKAKTLSVSRIDRNADFFINKVNVELSSFQLNFKFLDENYTFKLERPLPEYYSMTIVFAIALAFSAGVGVKESINILENNFNLPPGRLSVFKGIKNSIIIDSSYNSSLEPAVGALQLVNKIAEDRRKLGILGDMRELGSVSKIQHEALARAIIKNLNFAVIVGPEMGKYVLPILESKKFDFKHFSSFKESKEYIKNMVKKNDLILVKASQNNLFLERAVEILLVNKSDINLLARRGSYWNKIRQKTP